MQLEKFIEEYKEFCHIKFCSEAGTASSYANALRCLFRYLDVDSIDDVAISTVKSIEPDIREKHCAFYGSMLNYFSENGKGSYVKNGFVRAAIPVLYEFLDRKELLLNGNQGVLIDAVPDNKIVASFDSNKLSGILPIARIYEHTYNLRRVNGTTNDAVKRICDGRRAEKYFISYLRDYLGLKSGADFIDVSNNKEYGYDIRVFDVGIEVKNIKNGGFYLTDNEIARLEHTQTHLILVDVNNGIWLLKNNADWLKMRIDNIKSIRKYCGDVYQHLDLSDIRILIDESVNGEIVEISKLTKERLMSLLKLYTNCRIL